MLNAGKHWLIATLIAVMLTVLSGCSSGGTNSQSVASKRGAELYADHCRECHELAHPELLKQPPNLHGIFNGRPLPGGGPATDEQVRKTIVEGRGTMPAFDQRLKDDEVADLISFLHTMNR